MFSDLARHDTVRAVQEVEYQVIREICVTQRLDSESLFARSDKMADIIDNTTADIQTGNLVACALSCREYRTEYFRSITAEYFSSDLQRPALACSTTKRPRSAGR